MKLASDAYWRRVKGLFVPHAAPATIDRDINNYIDKIEGYTARLEDSYNRKDNAAVISVLENIQDMLQLVFAKQCEAHTNALLRSARTNSLDYSKKLLHQAIADFLLLSIEMQKAQYLGTAAAIKYKGVERNEEIARGLSAIGRLVGAGDYQRAQGIVSDMKEMDGVFNEIGSMLARREYDRAAETAKAMEQEHIEKINKSTTPIIKTVLAVDDRPEILSAVNAALRGHFKVFGAPGGQKALEILAINHIDLFVLDIDMPEMDGFELAKRIRGDRQYANTPIVFLTGNSTRDTILRALKLGISDFIVKPTSNATLLVKARRYTEE